jgi:hypothetical protein
MFDVFISYAREDAARVPEVEAVLTKSGFTVWHDACFCLIKISMKP